MKSFAISAAIVCALMSGGDALAQNDLALDYGFSGTGFFTLDFNDSPGKNDVGLGIQPVPCGPACDKHLIFGAHLNTATNTWDALISKVNSDGTLDQMFASAGKMQVATPLLGIVDVATDASATHFYFLGYKHTNNFTDSDFGISCIDANGAPCTGFGVEGTRTIYFDQGASNDDTPASIVFQPGPGSTPDRLLASGLVHGGTFVVPVNYIGIAALSAETGDLVPGFGGNGKALIPPITGEHTSIVSDTALSAAGTPGGERLYITASSLRGDDTKGYANLLAVNPFNGSLLTTSYGSEGALNLGTIEVAQAIAIQADGKVVVAGIGDPASTGHYRLILARGTPGGSREADFCNGGFCVEEGAGDISMVNAIGIRPMTHDLVIATSEVDGSEQVQKIYQFGEDGNVLHGERTVAFANDGGAGRYAISAALYVGSGLQGGYAMTVGTSRWSAITSDYNVTVVRMVASDEIFFSAFSGPNEY